MYDTAGYFSESQKQFVQVADMAMPYAKNVFAKLTREDGDNFKGSVLEKALADRLRPTRLVAKTLLATKGECSYFIDWSKGFNSVRGMFYKIGRDLGVKVHTEVKGDFIVATCEPVGEEVTIRVLHKQDKSKTFTRKGR